MSCLYCGVDMHDFSPKAIYCMNCYGKYGPWECYCVDEGEDECECHLQRHIFATRKSSRGVEYRLKIIKAFNL